jgi:hypothetical protein
MAVEEIVDDIFLVLPSDRVAMTRHELQWKVEGCDFVSARSGSLVNLEYRIGVYDHAPSLHVA